MNRELCGIYFRINRNDKWQNICFTDLTDEESLKVMENRTYEWLSELKANLLQLLVNINDTINDGKLYDLVLNFVKGESEKQTNSLTIDIINIKNMIQNIAEYYDIINDNGENYE